MPRDSSGVYTLPPGNPVVDGTVIDVNWANPTMADVAVQLNNVLTRDGLLGATAPIKFNDGTLALPGITWASETTMGFHRPSANTMALAIQGVDRQIWSPLLTTITTPTNFVGDVDVAGNFSIVGDLDFLGTITASGSFSIVGNVDGPLGFSATNNSGGTHAYAGFGATNNSGHTFGVAAVGNANTDFPANSDTGVLFSDHSQGTSLVTTHASGMIRFYTNGYGNERMRIAADGRVGIGAPASLASSMLEVTALNDARLVLNATGSGISSGGHIFFGRTNVLLGGLGISANRIGDSSTDMLYTSINNMRFNTGAGVGTEAMRIDTSQQVGIGTTAPANTFEVAGGGFGQITARVTNNVRFAGIKFINDAARQMEIYYASTSYAGTESGNINVEGAFPLLFHTNATERMRIISTGQVGIGGVVNPVDNIKLGVYDAAKVPAMGFIKNGIQGWYVGGDRVGSSNSFNISANGGPMLTIDPASGWIGCSSGVPGQSFFQLTQPGYDGNPKQFSAAGPYGNFMNFYGGSMSNGGGVVELNPHASVSLLGSWQMLAHSDIAGQDIIWRYATPQAARASLSYNERMRIQSSGGAYITDAAGGTHQMIVDPVNTNIPLGGIIMGRSFGSMSFSFGTTVAFSAGVGVSIVGNAGTVNITSGTFRFLGRDTNASNVDVSLWVRVA